MRNKPNHGEESYRGAERLKGKVALITGGDSGIGKAVAIAFAREGAEVALSYLPEEESDARETTEWVKKAGRKSLQSPGDIRDEAHCRELIDRVVSEFGHLDVLVNNAAFQASHEKLGEFDSEEWDRTFRTNIYSMFYLSKAAVPRMRKGGAIINTTSVQAYQPKGQLLAYATTKGAIVTFTKALSQLVIENGISRECRGSGAGMDPADSIHYAAGLRQEIRREGPHGKAVSTGGIGAQLCVFGERGVHLYYRLGDGSHRRTHAALGFREALLFFQDPAQ